MDININGLNTILQDTVFDIHNLDEYYNNQLDYVIGHTKKEYQKYYSGRVLFKFFLSKMNDEEENSITKEEKSIVDSLIKEWEIQCENGDKSISYIYKDGLSEDKKIDPSYAMRKSSALLNQIIVLGDSMIIMLLMNFETMISNIFELLIYKFPNILNEKSLTYSEIIGFKSDLDEIKRILVNRELDEFMRKPLKSWYEYFKSKHGVDVLSECTIFDEFREIYYRRNVVVHNQGLVNETYLKEVSSNNKIGDRLIIDRDYFEKAVSKTLIMVYHTIWHMKEVFNDDDLALTNYMFNQGYDYMVNKRWEVSAYIFKTIMKSNSISTNEYDKMCYQVNYWVSIKNIEGIEAIKDEVENKDVSAMEKTFLAAKYALLDDFEKLSKILDELINESIPANYIKEWPLFLQYRNTNEYADFMKRHINDFNEAKFDSNNETMGTNEDILNELGIDLSEMKN